MKNLSRKNLPLAILFLMGACGSSVHVTKLNQPPRPMQPRAVETVQVFAAGPPMRPRVDVAYLEAEQSSSFSTHKTPEIISNLRKKAADMGCDGVVIGGTGSRDPGVRDTETWITDDQKGRKSVYGTCIMFTDGPPSGYSHADNG